jgi:hypothetical protein
MGRPNRYGVRMPTVWCGSCPAPRLDVDHHFRSPIVIGPASCRACSSPVWFDSVGLRWLDADRIGHRCAA